MNNTVFEIIDITDLNNTEHLGMNNRIRDALVAANVPELAVHIPFYHNAIVAEDASIAKLLSNAKTEILANLDTDRDEVFLGGGIVIEGYTHHWDLPTQEAAKRLLVIHRTFRHIRQHNYQKESEDIVNYLQAMGDTSSNQTTMPTGGTTGGMTGGTGGGMTGGTGSGTGMPGSYSADVTLIGLGPWLDKLKEINNQLMTVYNDRTQDRVTAELLKHAKETRRTTDKLFRGCLNLLDMLVLNNGIEPYAQLVATINAIIHEWNTTLNIRKAKAKAKKENANNGGNTNTTPENGEENQGGENNGGENGEGGDNSDNNSGEDNTPSANA